MKDKKANKLDKQHRKLLKKAHKLGLLPEPLPMPDPEPPQKVYELKLSNQQLEQLLAHLYNPIHSLPTGFPRVPPAIAVLMQQMLHDLLEERTHSQIH